MKFGVTRTFCCLIAGMLLAASAARAATPEEIEHAIRKGKEFIYSKQQPGGHWEMEAVRSGDTHAFQTMQGDTFGGYTALATYALLASGESPNSPHVKAAVEFLKHADIIGVYALAMRLQVWLLIPHDTPQMRALIRRDAEALLKGINREPKLPSRGLWDYTGKGPRVDHSVSQYGVLGLWAAQQAGALDVATDNWRLFETAWRRDEQPDGGWNYGTDDHNTTPSMTAAGVATLFITADYLHAEEGVHCDGVPVNPWIDRGLAWIDAHYDQIELNEYTMYAVERIGAASGYRFFGGHDWYADLSDRLVHSQSPDGYWPPRYNGSAPLDATCFSLLFLARGRAPVMMNKLDYHVPSTTTAPTGPVDPVTWNERPRDVANLANWAGREIETTLNWQIVNLAADPADLHDAPVLYLSGNGPITLKPADAAKLKTFVEQGGMILGNADCGREAFAGSFRQLGESLFGRKFRELPADHPVFTHEQFTAGHWKHRPSVLGLSNGDRELMVLLPDSDPARWWQVPKAAEVHLDAFELGADLYQYAIDRQLWNRGESYFVKPDPAKKASHTLKVARLKAGSNWDPEPGGWRRLGAVCHNDERLDLSVFGAVPGQGELAAAHVAHLTGTTDFTLTDAGRLELSNFVKQGGTLVVDAAGGSPAFADAAARELEKMFGDAATAGLANPLAPDHAIYNLPGHKIETVAYRSWARLKGVGNLKTGRVRGIEIGGRTAVFFSREDLSAGLVGEPVDGIVGYTPESATQIMRNILLYSIERKSKP